MLTEERRNEIYNELTTEIQGGTVEDFFNIVDKWIDEFDSNGEYFKMSQEEWVQNEREICAIFDDNWFTCESCGWTMPNSEMSGTSDSCGDCEDENGEDD